MTTTSTPAIAHTANQQNHGRIVITAIAAFFFALTTFTSYARWADFAYRTFDLAYYVQAIWQLIHGRWEVTVEQVPLLGNHVEPIVFLFAPLFAVFRHPLLFVVVQNALLASMGPVGYAIARRRGFSAKAACLLGIALLLAPASGYIALHEFHPEALTAPFLLLMVHARVAKWVGRHWLWFVAVLACKENMALLLGAYCVVLSIIERRRGLRELLAWYLAPLVLAVSWFFLCTLVITPRFNAGNIDYLTLYNRLGASGAEILRNALTKPQVFVIAVFGALRHGNLLWALLLPFLFLPLLRPRWLLISAPILLQHLLSWRSSEWTIYFHYAAPLLPLFWLATVEAIHSPPAWLRSRLSLNESFGAWLVATACAVAFAWPGPLTIIATDLAHYASGQAERDRKNEFLVEIPPNASVVAGLPYLSHLAMREKVYSLHYILKGLKTLSHETYTPPPATDYVFIDYNDSATFDAGAGYYHAAMKTNDGRLILSSDELLHRFLLPRSWVAREKAEFLLLHQSNERPVISTNYPFQPNMPVHLADGSELMAVIPQRSEGGRGVPEIMLLWNFSENRSVFPWMFVRLLREGRTVAILNKGLCAPEARAHLALEHWQIDTGPAVAPGIYGIEAVLVDRAKQVRTERTGAGEDQSALLAPPIQLGEITVP